MEASEASDSNMFADSENEGSDNDTTVKRIDEPEEEVKYNIFVY